MAGEFSDPQAARVSGAQPSDAVLVEEIAALIQENCEPCSEGFGVLGTTTAASAILVLVKEHFVRRGGADTEQYALGVLVEEMGEVAQLVGKALRFGIDTPRVKGGETARELLHEEVGDVLAAVDYACERNVLTKGRLKARQKLKRSRLLDPNSRDARGRRLAP